MTSTTHHESKSKLLSAAQHVFRAKGYAAATIDDVCKAAELTKGSFFHHFKGKDELALAAAEAFSRNAEQLFATASYHDRSDPLQRLLGYVDFRIEMLTGALHEYTCLLGTLIQETYATHPHLRAACDQGLIAHLEALIPDIEAAKARYVPDAPWNAKSFAYYMQSVLQGAFIFAKATQDTAVARESLMHLRRHLELLFTPHGANPGADGSSERGAS